MITPALCFALLLVPNGGGQPIVLSGYDTAADAEAAYKAADPMPPVDKRPCANGPVVSCFSMNVFLPIFGRHYVFPAPLKDCVREHEIGEIVP